MAKSGVMRCNRFAEWYTMIHRVVHGTRHTLYFLCLLVHVLWPLLDACITMVFATWTNCFMAHPTELRCSHVPNGMEWNKIQLNITDENGTSRKRIRAERNGRAHNGTGTEWSGREFPLCYNYNGMERNRFDRIPCRSCCSLPSLTTW